MRTAPSAAVNGKETSSLLDSIYRTGDIVNRVSRLHDDFSGRRGCALIRVDVNFSRQLFARISCEALNPSKVIGREIAVGGMQLRPPVGHANGKSARHALI